MLYIITGEGKGKTTSAVGTIVRASHYKKSILFAQFAKFETAEMKFFNSFANVICVSQNTFHPFFFKGDRNYEQKFKINLLNFWGILTAYHFSGKEIIVLDEINNCIFYGYINPQKVIDTIEGYPGTDWILTGRNACPKLIAMADVVSEINNVKYNKKDIQEGIEY